jgi:hypothetical protein
MKKEILTRANELEKEIKEIEYFLTTLGITDKKHSKFKSAFISIENKKTISLFGSRYFGYGSHNSNIIIPSVLLEDLVKVVKKRLYSLEKEYKNL